MVKILAYHKNDRGRWVAELDCGHHRPVRDRNPFQKRKWVVTDRGQLTRLGDTMACWLCPDEVTAKAEGPPPDARP